tara:strand:- start:1869 stop:2174 length:306 start_codon:yes stop_codon:yes gene_type:complete
MSIIIASPQDLNPNLSEKDQMIHLANLEVEKAMKDPVFYQELRERQAEFELTKGMSGKRNLKMRVSIPQDAVNALPPEIRNDNKELLKWVKRYHPYLMLTK